MSASSASFWDRLSQSGIVATAVAESLRAQYRSAGNGDSPAVWLTDNGILSPFQAQLLVGGYAGPFAFSEYTLLKPRPPILGQATYLARHIGTKHPVQLCFVKGDSTEDLSLWQAITQRVGHLRPVDQPHLLRTYESIELAEYRLVVVDSFGGKSLNKKLGSKGRIDWKHAVQLVHSLAKAVGDIHAIDLTHGNITDHEVWVDSGGHICLAPPFWPTRLVQPSDATSTSLSRPSAADYVAPDRWNKPMGEGDDVYALCVLLYRIIRGETPHQYLRSKSTGSTNIAFAIDKLSKYEIPPGLSELLRRGLSTAAEDRLSSVTEFSQALKSLAAEPVPAAQAPRVKTREPYVQWLERWRPAVTKARQPVIESTVAPVSVTPRPEFKVDLRVDQVAQPSRKKKSRRRVQLTVWITCAAAIIASFFAISRAVQSGRSIADSDGATSAINAPDTVPVIPDAAEVDTDVTTNVGTRASLWRQNVVDDNRELLWQSPTEGPPIDFRSFPPGAALIVAVRPSDLANNEESARMVQSLGDEFIAYLEGLESTLTVPPAEIRQLIIGYYPASPSNDICSLVRLLRPVSRSTLVAEWTRRGFTADPNQLDIWVSGEQALGIPATLPATPPAEASGEEDPPVAEFVVGRIDRVADALRVTSENPLSGPLAQLVSRTDEQRHWTILALKSAAFGELGRQLLPERFHSLQREISLLIEDQVRALAISGHLDNGSYLEVVFDESADIAANELRNAVDQKLRGARDRLRMFLAQTPPHPHWDQVRIRFDGMLTDVFRQLRIGVEYDQVLMNVWMPPMAPHNLMAAAELTLSARPGGASDAAVAQPSLRGVPGDLTSLLATKRTMQNDNPPDLNVLLDGLQREIEIDYPGLPFLFQIRLSNTDLGEAGITRNQRLGPLSLVDLPLADVLTQICFLANPDKNATSPADPRCKLIWVLMRDEESNTDVILITTRQGAAKNGWTIPPQFTSQPEE